jgi:hypothetical protein
MGNIHVANTDLLFNMQGNNYLTNASTSISTSTWTITNSVITITPQSATSKILLMASGDVNGNSMWTFFRNGGQLVSPGWAGSNVYANITFSWLDTAGTTSPITYAVYGKTNGVGTIMWSWASYPSTVSIMAIELGP